MMNRYLLATASKHLRVTALMATLLAVPLAAADVLITNARLVTGTDQGTLLNAAVRINKGLIADVETDANNATATEVVDANGAYVTAGFFDSSTTLGTAEVGGGIPNRDYTVRDTDMGAGFQVSLAINRFSSLIPMMRVQGVTRAMVPPAAGNNIFAGQSALINLGTALPMVTIESNAVFVDLRESATIYSGGSRAKAILDLLDALDEAKIYSNNTKAYRAGKLREFKQSERDLRALVPLLQGDKPLALMLDRAADIETVIAQLQPYKLKLVIVGGSEAWKVAKLLADQKIPVVINPMDNLPSSFDQLGARLDNAALLVKAGVKIALMTEDVYTETRSLVQGAGVAVAYGLDWHEAIKAITVNPAEIWGLPGYGTVTVGQRADLVIWDGDPLEITSRPVQMMIDGAWMSMTTRQTLLRDRYSDLQDTKVPFGYK
jgi:imidazolonepropionase-like amidohydrolase